MKSYTVITRPEEGWVRPSVVVAENRCFSLFVGGLWGGLRKDTVPPVLQPCFTSPLPWTACCSALPPPLFRPRIKAGLSATAAHQGAPHPHLQQHCPLGVLLWSTHMGANTQEQTQEPTRRFTQGASPPRFSQKTTYSLREQQAGWDPSYAVNTCKLTWITLGCEHVCTWVHKLTQVHMCCCQVKETGNVIQSTCYALTEQTHYALGAAFSTYKQTPEQTSATACLHVSHL